MTHISVTAAATPDKPAIIMGDTGVTVSYRELDQRSNRAAQLFRSQGLVRGDHIGMMIENDRQFLEIAQGALRSGIIFTPISTHLREEETRYILENCEAKLFVGSRKLAAVAREIVGDIPAIQHFYMINGTEPGFESWEAATAEMPAIPIEDQSVGFPMLYSSGTTGQPKGVLTMSDMVNIGKPIQTNTGKPIQDTHYFKKNYLPLQMRWVSFIPSCQRQATRGCRSCNVSAKLTPPLH